MIHRFTMSICDDCLNLRGKMCHKPECVFCRHTMKEVSEILELLQIRFKGEIIQTPTTGGE